MSNPIDDLVEVIKRLVGTGCGVDAFIDPLHRLITAAPYSTGSQYEPGARLFRATKHHRQVPKHITELGSPPPAVTPQGRANRLGDPRFYCASDPLCAMREIGAEVGQMVVHAEWQTTEKMTLHDLGYTASVLARAGAKRALPERHEHFYSEADPEQRRVRDFIAELFTEPSNVLYEVTAAIAEIHLRSSDIVGILYPSVARSANVDNLALRADFASTALRLQSAQVVNVEEVREDGSISGTVLCDLESVAPDGQLNWCFRLPPDAKIPPGSTHAARVGDRLRVHSAGEIEIGDGHRYRVEVGFLLDVTADGIVVRDLQGQPVPPLP